MLRTLKEEHGRMLALVGRLRTLMCDADDPRVIVAGVMREECVRFLSEHQTFKIAMIYRPLKRSARPNRMSVVLHMEELNTILHEDYARHRALWPVDRIEADWTAYKGVVIDLLDRVENLIQLERFHVYGLIEDEAPAHSRAA